MKLRRLNALLTRPLRRTKKPALRAQPSRNTADVDHDQCYRDANDCTNDGLALESSKSNDDRAEWKRNRRSDPHAISPTPSHCSGPLGVGHVITDLFYGDRLKRGPSLPVHHCAPVGSQVALLTFVNIPEY